MTAAERARTTRIRKAAGLPPLKPGGRSRPRAKVFSDAATMADAVDRRRTVNRTQSVAAWSARRLEELRRTWRAG